MLAQSQRLLEQKERSLDLEGSKDLPRVLIVEDNLRYGIELMKALKERAPEQGRPLFEVDLTPDASGADEYLAEDSVDIYVVDLGLADPQNLGSSSFDVGKRLVEKILRDSNAGVVVHSSLPAEIEAPALLAMGVDDYIEKITSIPLVKAKLLALWRRVQMSQPARAKTFAHTSRVFQLGSWRFEVGNRQLKNLNGSTIKLTSTEHAILRYLCVIEGNAIDKATFNAEILGRPDEDIEKRADNYIYRLRNKLGPSTQLMTLKDGSYKLLDIQEVSGAT